MGHWIIMAIVGLCCGGLGYVLGRTSGHSSGRNEVLNDFYEMTGKKEE